MRTVVVSTPADLLALDGAENTLVKFAVGVVKMPQPAIHGPVVLKNLRGVTFLGSSGPKGRVCLSGWPLLFLDCQGVHFEKIAFRLVRPSVLTPVQYERWWSSPRLLSSTDNATRDVSFIRCSFSGNTDEIAIRRQNDADVAMLAASRIRFEECVVGRSIQGLDATHGVGHNFGIAASRVDYLTMVRNAIGGHNRRCLQLQGRSCQFHGNAVYDWGTGCVMLHNGSEIVIGSNAFLAGPHTPLRIAPVMPVVGTMTSGYSNLEPRGIDLQIQMSAWFKPGAEPIQTRMAVVPTISPVTTAVASDVISGKIGVGDSVDVALGRMMAARNVPWVFDEPFKETDY